LIPHLQQQQKKPLLIEAAAAAATVWKSSYMNQGLDKRPLAEEEAPSSQVEHHIVNSNKQTNKDLATAAQSFEQHLRHVVGSQKQSKKEQTKQETRENQKPKGGRGGLEDFTRSTNLQPVANRFVAPQRVSHEKKKIKGT